MCVCVCVRVTEDSSASIHCAFEITSQGSIFSTGYSLFHLHLVMVDVHHNVIVIMYNEQGSGHRVLVPLLLACKHLLLFLCLTGFSFY